MVALETKVVVEGNEEESPLPSEVKIQHTEVIIQHTEVKIQDNTGNMENDVESGLNDSGVNVSVSGDVSKVTMETSEREHRDSMRSEHSRDADIDIRVENESGEVVKGKRKRRKKRKNGRTTRGQEMPSTSQTVAEGEVNNEEIFDMDDLSTDDELSQLTSNMASGSMAKSISLPVVEENKLERTHEWASAHEGFQYLNNHPFSDTDLSPLARYC